MIPIPTEVGVSKLQVSIGFRATSIPSTLQLDVAC